MNNIKKDKKMKKLRRTKYPRVLGGVCEGFGKYFNIDPVLVRLLWLLAVLGLGVGVLAYIICWIIIPVEE